MTDWGSCVKRMCATPYFLLNRTFWGVPDCMLYVLIESSSPAVTSRSSVRWKSSELMRSAVSCEQQVHLLISLALLLLTTGAYYDGLKLLPTFHVLAMQKLLITSSFSCIVLLLSPHRQQSQLAAASVQLCGARANVPGTLKALKSVSQQSQM